jgi:hypothetical protein
MATQSQDDPITSPKSTPASKVAPPRRGVLLTLLAFALAAALVISVFSDLQEERKEEINSSGVTITRHEHFDLIKLKPGEKWTYVLNPDTKPRWDVPEGKPGHYIQINAREPVFYEHGDPFEIPKVSGGQVVLRAGPEGSEILWYGPRLDY